MLALGNKQTKLLALSKNRSKVRRDLQLKRIEEICEMVMKKEPAIKNVDGPTKAALALVKTCKSEDMV